MFDLSTLPRPIVQAPLAGGASTPALAAAVIGAGGLGFLAAGYKTPDAFAAELDDLRSRLADGAPFGVNLFADPGHGPGEAQLEAYAQRLRDEGVELGQPRWDDDGYRAKLELLIETPVPIVSFTFAAPSEQDVERLHAVGSAVWVTVTTFDEAWEAARGRRRRARRPGRRGGRAPRELRRRRARRPRGARVAAADPCRPAAAVGGERRTDERGGRRRRSGRRRFGCPAGDRIHALPGSGDAPGAPGGTVRIRTDGGDPRVHRPLGPRDPQPLPRRERRRSERVPADPSPDRPDASRRARRRRPGLAAPVGRSGVHADPGPPGGRAGSRTRCRGTDGPADRRAELSERLRFGGNRPFGRGQTGRGAASKSST